MIYIVLKFSSFSLIELDVAMVILTLFVPIQASCDYIVKNPQYYYNEITTRDYEWDFKC